MFDWRKTAAIFPGQGSQLIGMGKDFAEHYEVARQTFLQADDILGYSLSSLCWAGPQEQLNQTEHTQPALYVCSVAIWRVLRQLLAECDPKWLAGHSLGEFSALTAAGALSFEDGLRLVRARGELMRKAGEENPGAMAALLGLQVESVRRLCAQISQSSQKTLVLANDNCPGQAVISGAESAVDRAITLAKEVGARRAVKLAVSVAAHSPLMASASEQFNTAVAATAFVPPQARILGNVSAEVLDSVEAIRIELQEQLTQSVRWTESMQAIIADGADTFLEVGAGTVLSGLMRRIDRKRNRISLNTVPALETFLESIA